MDSLDLAPILILSDLKNPLPRVTPSLPCRSAAGGRPARPAMARRPRASRVPPARCSPREVGCGDPRWRPSCTASGIGRAALAGGGSDRASVGSGAASASSTLRSEVGGSEASFAGAGGAYATPHHHRQLHPHHNSTPGKFPVPRYYETPIQGVSMPNAMRYLYRAGVPFPSSGAGMAGSVPCSTPATTKGARVAKASGAGQPKRGAARKMTRGLQRPEEGKRVNLEKQIIQRGNGGVGPNSRRSRAVPAQALGSFAAS